MNLNAFWVLVILCQKQNWFQIINFTHLYIRDSVYPASTWTAWQQWTNRVAFNGTCCFHKWQFRWWCLMAKWWPTLKLLAISWSWCSCCMKRTITVWVHSNDHPTWQSKKRKISAMTVTTTSVKSHFNDMLAWDSIKSQKIWTCIGELYKHIIVGCNLMVMLSLGQLKLSTHLP